MPHWCPPTAESTTADRCAFHAGFDGSGAANQYAMTAGCIADTSATDGSPPASARNAWATGRVLVATSTQVPPASTGTAMSGRPQARSSAKSFGSRWRRSWRSVRWARQSSARSVTAAQISSAVGAMPVDLTTRSEPVGDEGLLAQGRADVVVVLTGRQVQAARR